MAVVHVDLWIWTLQQPAAVQSYASLLSGDERARAQRFLSAVHRDSYIVGRGRMRAILATYLQQPAATLKFSYGASGKPFLTTPAAPHFNLSHSDTTAALAVTVSSPIGLDIEAHRPLTDDIAGRFFSAAEIEALHALPEAARAAAFFRCWTRKEAVVKALGDGLNRPLTSFDVSIADVDQPLLLRMSRETDDELARWRLFNFIPAPGLAGAVACRVPAAHDTLDVAYRT